MRGWNEKSIEWYLRAGEYSQYPRLVLDEIIPHLEADMTVLDIGCGPGLYALALSPLVKKIYAMDRQKIVLDTLAGHSKASNISYLHEDWPNTTLRGPVDVIISAFGSGQTMNSKEGITAMLNLKPKLIFLVAPGDYTPPFGWHADKFSESADRTTDLLTELGLHYATQHLRIDFGQPVRDWEEASDFLSSFLRISPTQALEHAQNIAVQHPWGLYLPNPRNAVIIKVKDPQ